MKAAAQIIPLPGSAMCPVQNPRLTAKRMANVTNIETKRQKRDLLALHGAKVESLSFRIALFERALDDARAQLEALTQSAP